MNLSAHQATPTVNLQLLVGHGASLLITSFGIEWELHIYACFVGLFWFVGFFCVVCVFLDYFSPADISSLWEKATAAAGALSAPLKTHLYCPSPPT